MFAGVAAAAFARVHFRLFRPLAELEATEVSGCAERCGENPWKSFGFILLLNERIARGGGTASCASWARRNAPEHFGCDPLTSGCLGNCSSLAAGPYTGA